MTLKSFVPLCFSYMEKMPEVTELIQPNRECYKEDSSRMHSDHGRKYKKTRRNIKDYENSNIK